MMKFFTFILFLTGMKNFGNTANILAVFPYPLYSHYISFMPILKELASRGHNVTVVSEYPQKSPVPNLTDIVVPSLIKEMLAHDRQDDLEMGTLSFLLFKMYSFWMRLANIAMETEPMKKLIADNNSKFDLVLTETGCIHEQFVTFGHKFNAPVINLLSLFHLPLIAYTTGNSMPTSYVPVTLYFNFNDRMSFLERVQNSFFYYWHIFYGHFYYYKKQNELIRKHFKYPGSETIPPVEDMLRNTSLTLMEYDFTAGYPAPLHKNVVLFSGVHIKQPDPLPDDLQKYMDENQDGIIYFSMGSVFGMISMAPYMKEAILSALNKLNHKILMKYHNDSLTETLNNKNIMIRTWFPQRAILAHPNCKLFITHSGIHGTMEGFYHGVPMVAIPLLGDQRYNAKIIETYGLGVSVDINTITEEKVLTAINEVLNNPKYEENAKKRSAIFKDTPMNTMDNVIYWIEYVIRHKGAPHLRPAVLDLYWFQRFMLDVIAFYLFIILFVIYILKIVVSLFLRCLRNVFYSKKSAKREQKIKLN